MRKTLGNIRLLNLWIADISIELRGASDHPETLEDALSLLLVWVAGACVGVPNSVGQLALEDL